MSPGRLLSVHIVPQLNDHRHWACAESADTDKLVDKHMQLQENSCGLLLNKVSQQIGYCSQETVVCKEMNFELCYFYTDQFYLSDSTTGDFCDINVESYQNIQVCDKIQLTIAKLTSSVNVNWNC